MKRVHLPISFVSQSLTSAPLTVRQRQEHAGVLAALVEADGYPRTGVLRVTGLSPNRHYLLGDRARQFCRTDADGMARLELTLTGPIVLLLSPVV